MNKGIHFPVSWDNEQIWWTVFTNIDYRGDAKTLILGGQILFSLIFLLFLSRRIRRNPSAELSFFYLFLFSFSLQLFRLPYLMDNLPLFFLEGGLSTRIVYFSRILALSSLFAASLFSMGLQIQKFGMVLLISFLTAFTLSTLLPVNNSIVTGALINRIARERNMALFCGTMEVLAILNYISAGRNEGRREYYRLALFCLILVCGYELLFYLHIPFAIPGFACLISGSILFIRTSRKLFLWG